MRPAWISYAALLGVGVLSGCSGDGERADIAWRSPVPGTHWIVAVDLSASRTASQLHDSQQFVASILDVARNGDKITLMRIYESGLSGPNFVWSYEIPASGDPGHPSVSDSLELRDASRAVRAELTVLFDPVIEGKLQGTDIFATLYRVSDLVHAEQLRRPTLYLLSDMLQSTRQVDMESRIPDTGWVRAQARKRFVPDLRGVCVVAIGPDISTGRGQRALTFWRAYFEAAGAELRDANYRNWAPSAAGLGCN